uniref:KIF-binding protein n=1 Tax=Pseudo-nitzschia australis TaxID=44445 RepID=A0A7S4AIA5_9STRA|mmetsp:Transcript_11072/g.23518  ORF Transcript_11072/g.23518 Transcript_11072/m.23518 type:complete len:337 (+) Transcript_11072:172-1182(+)|eukprot:CAMPEP_0168200910 /NCGR_PEP_ID=MMETSP0139_2-20121125/23352_1 /TAXON_ID=44445 /ORGANISM="Pseudo-nitzschia australis, Strain 10249 10 AB" /LENGTH=336 /DNA_ID=CAMNT_0008126285 /DNA_START=194 /DNA_END=1204 /DNA_ORIENTATION=-
MTAIATSATFSATIATVSNEIPSCYRFACIDPVTGGEARIALARGEYEHIRTQTTRTRINDATASTATTDLAPAASRNGQQLLFLAKYKYATALNEYSIRSDDLSEALQMANELMDFALFRYGATHGSTLNAYTLLAKCQLQVSGNESSPNSNRNRNGNCSNSDRVLRIYKKVLETWNRKRGGSSSSSMEPNSDADAVEAGAFRTMLLLADLHRNEKRFSEALPLAQEALALASTGFVSNLDSDSDSNSITTNTLRAQHCLGMIYFELATKAAATHDDRNKNNTWTTETTDSQQQWHLAKSHLEKAAVGLLTLYGENHPTTIESVHALEAVHCKLN